MMIKLIDQTVIAENQFGKVVIPCTADTLSTFDSTSRYNKEVLCGLKGLFRDNLFYYQIHDGFKVYLDHSSINGEIETVYLNAYDLHQPNTFVCEFNRQVVLLGLNKGSNVEVLVADAIASQDQNLVHAYHQSKVITILNHILRINKGINKGSGNSGYQNLPCVGLVLPNTNELILRSATKYLNTPIVFKI
jgi:hypothetical protein